MANTQLIIRTAPDALVKVFGTHPETIVYLDNTDDHGTTPPINLKNDDTYYIDVTVYPET